MSFEEVKEQVDSYTEEFSENFKLDGISMQELLQKYTVKIPEEDEYNYDDLRKIRARVSNLLSEAQDKLALSEAVLKALSVDVNAKQREKVKDIIKDYNNRKKQIPQNSTMQTMAEAELAEDLQEHETAELQVSVWKRIITKLNETNRVLDGIANLYMSENKQQIFSR